MHTKSHVRGTFHALILAGILVCGSFQTSFADAPSSSKLRALNASISETPTDPSLFLQRAEVLYSVGRLDDAIADIDHALALDRDPFAFLLRGQIYEDRGDAGAAILDYTRFIGADKSNHLGYWYRARAFRSFGWFDRALIDLQKAKSLHATATLAIAESETLQQLNRPQDALKTLVEAQETFGLNVTLSRSLYSVALAHNPLLAVNVATEMVEVADQPARWLLRRAVAYRALGEINNASEDVKAALVSADLAIERRRSPLNLMVRGEARMAAKQWDDAIEDFREAVARAPHLTRAHSLIQEAEARR